MMDRIGSWESYLRQMGFQVSQIPAASSQIGAHFRIDVSHYFYMQDVKLPCYGIVTNSSVSEELANRVRRFVNHFEENVLLLQGEPAVSNIRIAHYQRSLRSANIRPVALVRIAVPARAAETKSFLEEIRADQPHGRGGIVALLVLLAGLLVLLLTGPWAR